MNLSCWLLQPVCRLLRHRPWEVRLIGASNWVVACLRCGLIMDKHPPDRKRIYCDPTEGDYLDTAYTRRGIPTPSAGEGGDK